MMSVLRARVLVVAAALAMALAFPAGVAIAQQVPALPFSPSSSAGGLSSSAASALFCGLPGEADCTFTGPPRMRATSQELSWTFAGDTDSGMTWNNGNSMCLRVGGYDGWCVGDNFAPGVYAFYSSQNGAPYMRSIAALGAAAAPGYSFYGAQSTGMFALAGGGLGFTANATNSMNVWQTFVSYAVPLRLDVNGTQANPQIYFVTDPSADSGIWYDSTGDGAPVLSNNSGDVAIVASDDTAIIGADLVSMTSTANDVNLVPADDVNLSGGDSVIMTTMTGVLMPPAVANTAPVKTLPTCTSAIPGAQRYIDDTNDAKPGVLCVCAADETDAFAWRGLAYQTGAWVAATCPP